MAFLRQTASNPIKSKSPENLDFPGFLSHFDKI